jgi:biotin carboxyl carrier protein
VNSDGRAIPSPVTVTDFPADDEAWTRFVGAATSEEFCSAWLSILCRQMGTVVAGVVLLESGESNTFAPIAVWPKASAEMARLGTVAERALAEGRGIVHRDTEAPGALAQIAYPVQASNRTVGAVALEITASADVTVMLRQLHWAIAWLRDLLLRRELQTADARTAKIGSIMEAVATSLSTSKLQQTLFDITNHVGRHLRCSRVGIGLTERHSIRVTALSDAAWFEKDTVVVKRYAAAMEEASDRRSSVAFVRGQSSADAGMSAHELLANDTAAVAVVSAPLLLGATSIGAITLERAQGGAFTDEDLAWIEAFAGLLSSVIDQKRRAERSYLKRLEDDSRKVLERLFGSRHLVWKFATSVLLLTLAVLIFAKIEYRVTAKTVIEGEIQRTAVAPFEGFIAASHVRAGDTVREGQVLCELDDRDLKIEQAKWTSEREQSDKKLREAMAGRNFANVQMSTAQLKEAEAQLALASERIRRTKITAPFDGVVVSGDLSQLIGSPVEQGKKLFEIAPLASYRVILQVDEREIRNVEVGQSGKLVIAGIAGDPSPFDVVKVTPVATAEDGRNFFRVEALLQAAPPRLRPGMEGVGKIGVGQRRLWWILTHTFTDWLRLTLWSWMP